MLAVLAGLGAALAFGTSTLASTRASRLIGAWPTVGWVTLVGLPAALAAAASDVGGVIPAAAPMLLLAGLGNVVGLVLGYSALRIGRVGIVAPLVSAEGAVAALLSVATGAPLTGALLLALTVIVVGGALTAGGGAANDPPGSALARRDAASALLAIAAAISFGAGIYAAGRLGQSLPIGWVLLPARAMGVLLVTLPLLAAGRLRMSRAAAPAVVIAGVAELVGFTGVGLGARADIAVTAVLASQFAAAAVIGALFLYRERLVPVQAAGIGAIAVGTALVALWRP